MLPFKSYVYEINCNAAQLGDCKLTQQFPNMRLITINSVVMTDYTEVIETCMRLLEDLCEHGGAGRFKIICEVNPAYGGKAITKDWDSMELTRFWMHDTTAEGASDSNIVAIGNAVVYGSFIGPEADA